MAEAPTTAADPRRVGPRAPGWLLGSCGVVAALVVWIVASHLLAGGGGVINRLPPPAPVFRKLLEYASSDLAQDLISSIKVFLVGWAVAVILAAVIGLLLGRVHFLGRIFLPIIEAIRPVSSIAWVPLSIVWFGFGFTSKAFLVGLAVFLVVIVYAVDGAGRIAPELWRTATMLGMNGWQRFRNLIVPGTLAEVLIGARVSLMAGWGTVIVAELVAADSGLGAHLIAVQQSYNVPAVLATMICFGAAGFLMNALFTMLERRLMPWRRDDGSLRQ